jgi:hypothetical protein
LTLAIYRGFSSLVIFGETAVGGNWALAYPYGRMTGKLMLQTSLDRTARPMRRFSIEESSLGIIMMKRD